MEPDTSPAGLADATTASGDNLYAVKPIPGKGQGTFATSAIPKGTRIISESSIFKLPGLASHKQFMECLIVTELKQLSKDKQRAFLSLHNAHADRHGVFVGIVKTNALPLGAGASDCGLFPGASRINHSCNPNAQNTWNPKLDRLTIHAIKDIDEGQEITVSYLDESKIYSARQMKLKASFGFDCLCELSSLPPAQRHQSDQRMEEIARLDELIGDGRRIVSTPVACLHDAHTLLRLLEQEDVTDARVSRLYYDALQIAIANGDQGRARVFAERGYAVRVICEGEDGPETAEMKRLAERPSQHRLYGISMRWKSALNSVPQGLGEQEFENWLWKTSRH